MYLRHLKFDDQVENGTNERIKRAYHYNLTEAEVREEVFQMTEAKKRKLEEAKSRKIEKENKKINKASQLQSFDNTIDFVINMAMKNDDIDELAGIDWLDSDEHGNENVRPLETKNCYKCKSSWLSCEHKLSWRACENCCNWCCFLCSDLNFLIGYEYFCDNCK
jgi:hypothetical protein